MVYHLDLRVGQRREDRYLYVSGHHRRRRRLPYPSRHPAYAPMFLGAFSCEFAQNGICIILNTGLYLWV